MDPRYKSPDARVDELDAHEFRDLEILTNSLKWLLRAGVLLAVFSLISSYMQLELLQRPFTDAEGEANDMRERAIGIVTWLTMIATMIIFGRWIVLAHRNVQALGATYVEFTPGWALGWFFIPIANLWKPYQAMRSLWQYSSNVHDAKHVEPIWVLPVWWTLWLLSTVVGNALARLTLKARTLDDFIVSTKVAIFACLFDVALYAVASVLVWRIWEAQRKQKDHPAETQPGGFANVRSAI